MRTISFEELSVWSRSHEFTLSVCKMTSSFPREEMIGLVSQFRRAGVSVPANITEGYKRKGLKDKLKFYNIAQSSLEECRYYLGLSNDLKYAHIKEEREMLIQVSKMLESYIKGIRRNANL